eukprot:scaffold29820_cov95-Cyclotella_meneghiniana.AAC.7
MNNPTDDGGGHQTRALTVHSPNEEDDARQDETRNACENARLNNEQPNRRWRQSSEESLDSTLT